MLCLVDYLTFTHTNITTPRDMINFLGLESLQGWEEGYGDKFYPKALYLDGIKILYGAKKRWSNEKEDLLDMGVCFSASGTGCRNLETLANIDWFEIFDRLINTEGVNVTRLDLACDEKEGILNIKTIARYVRDRKYTSHIRNRQVFEDLKGAYQSLSIRFGSEQSDFLLRIYDKAAERGFEGQHWIRTEMQLRRGLATNAMREIVKRNDIGIVFTGVLNNYVRFIKRDSTRDERCSTVKWWADFLRTSEKIRIFERPGIEYNKSRLDKYIEQTLPSIYTWLTLEGGDLSAFMKLVKSYKGRLSDKQKVLIERAIRAGEIDGYL